MKKHGERDKLAEFALLGAKLRLTQLEEEVYQTKQLMKLLSKHAASPSKPKKAKVEPEKKRSRRKHSAGFKARVVERAHTHGISDAAGRFDVARSLVHKWMSMKKGG